MSTTRPAPPNLRPRTPREATPREAELHRLLAAWAKLACCRRCEHDLCVETRKALGWQTRTEQPLMGDPCVQCGRPLRDHYRRGRRLPCEEVRL